MAEERKYDVFICNSRQDSESSLLITNILESNGYTCFIDVKCISTGEEFAKSIANAIMSCSIFLFVHSAYSIQSWWCMNELRLADQTAKPILTICIDDTQLSGGLLFRLGTRHSLSLHSPNFEITLLNKIGEWLGRNNSEPLTQEQRNQNLEAAEEHRNGSKN